MFLKIYLQMPRWLKRAIMIGIDTLLLPLMLLLAWTLRLGHVPPTLDQHWWVILLAPLFCIPTFAISGLYLSVIRFVGPQVMMHVAKGVALGTLLLALAVHLSGTQSVPRSLYFIFALLSFTSIAGIRFAARGYIGWLSTELKSLTPVAIYGSGNAGVHLATGLAQRTEYLPVCFIDDNPSLQGSVINGITVYSVEALADLRESLGLTRVMLAIPSATRKQKRRILESLLRLNFRVSTVPDLNDLKDGGASLQDLRDVDLSDLLERESVPPYSELLLGSVKNKTVLITGAGGSIGSELCRQILALHPRQLILFELSEYALYRIEMELSAQASRIAPSCKIFPILGCVRNKRRMQETIEIFKVQTIFHAAANKHVPIVEQNIAQGLATNVLGTLSVAQAAIAQKVESFVLVSTDKAVRPTNVMGASKRLAEMIIQSLAEGNPKTKMCMVRFGNVLGSSGSVVPLFKEQIRNGGPLTVTHPEVTRYFMTVPEAAQLVIQASAMALGGEVFVLDMGKPVRIVELAKKMIRLSGLQIRNEENPDGDIEIVFTGLRPGEKLFEELFIGNSVSGTNHPMISQVREECMDWNLLEGELQTLAFSIDSQDALKMQNQLQQLVDGYVPPQKPHDLVWCSRELKASTILFPNTASH